MNPFIQATVRGEALETLGFENRGTIDGWGLLTFGLIWNCHNIWIGVSPILSTSWATVWGTSSTIWTGVSGGQWGDC